MCPRVGKEEEQEAAVGLGHMQVQHEKRKASSLESRGSGVCGRGRKAVSVVFPTSEEHLRRHRTNDNTHLDTLSRRSS